jgi:hypothetical protein
VDGWSDEPRSELWDVVNDVDADNTRWLVDVVTEHCWPGMFEVGKASGHGRVAAGAARGLSTGAVLDRACGVGQDWGLARPAPHLR